MAKAKTVVERRTEAKKVGGRGVKEEKTARKSTSTASKKTRRQTRTVQRKETTKPLFEAACRLAKTLQIRTVFVYAQTITGNLTLPTLFDGGQEVVLVVKGEEDERNYRGLAKKIIRVPDVDLSRMDQVKLAAVIALTERVISIGDRILCLVGRVNRTSADTLVVLDLGDEFETMSMHSQVAGSKDFDSKVFEATLTMALELAHQGREGRPIGAIFVLGDDEEVMRYSRQMIINPFEGHPETSRNILDPNLRETVKGFASLDGAFVIRKDGVLVAAGRHLNAAYDGDSLPTGLGARHAAAAAITEVTRSLALTISESTGTVTVFRSGKIMMTLERFRQAHEVTEPQE
jgi:DNA integrity scanning protein DisA with diadenylate cyclase activity